MASDDQSKVLEDAKKLAYGDRATHKAWFVRVALFDDIGAACKRALDPGDAVFAEAGPLFAKGIGDANANVADKALEALLLYLDNTNEDRAARVAGPACGAIASKVLKGRPGTVKKATDVCLALVEWEQTDEVLEPMFKAFGDKVPKTVVAALDIVTQAFSQFGPRVVKPQPIARALPALFDARQEQVRDGVKKLAVELSGWLGVDYVNGSLCGKMPDLMRKDVEKLMEESPPSKKQPERYTKKEQAARAAAAESAAAPSAAPGAEQQAGGDGAASAAAAGPAEPMEMDAYEYAEPANILPDLNKEFWDGLNSKKWSERRDSLQRLKSLAGQPRLAPGDFGDVLRELKKIILKDSNVVCVGEAILCIGAFAKSLRSSFAGSAKGFVPVILEKYKDPKTSIGTAVTDSLSQMHKYCLPLPDLAEDFTAALTHKNPKIKVDGAKLLQACIDASSRKDAAKVHAQLLPVAAKAANDPAPDVREANMRVLVAFAVKSGNLGLLDKVGDSFDETRKKRLHELARLRNGGAPAEPPRAAAAVSRSIPAAASPAARPAAAKAVGSRVGGVPTTKPSTTRPGVSKAAPKKAGAGGAAGAAASLADDDDAGLAGGTLSDRDAKEALLGYLGEQIFDGLQDGQWKARLTSMEALLEKVQGSEEVAPETASMLIQGVAHVPGWSEKNFQVLGKSFELVTHLTSTSVVGKKDAFTAIGGLVEKISDIKLKGPAGEALFAISEALGPQFVFIQLHKKAANHKNPKVLSESLLWMGKAIEDFGLSIMNVQQLIGWIKADLASTNAAVRNAAIQVAATCHRQLGTGLAAMLRSDVKPALMTALEDAFKSHPQAQVVPTRTVRTAKPSRKTENGTGAEVAIEANGANPMFDADSLLPRVDVSGQLGPRITAGLGSSNWKERNHTMEDVENIVRAAGRIQPTVGDLIPALKARLTDSNKNLVARALSIFGEIAKAMGPAWERAGKPVLGQAVTFLADNKKQVRDAAVGALDAWVVAVSAEKVVPTVADFLAGSRASAEGKTTGLRWLAGIAKEGRATKCSEVMLKAAAVGGGDKAVEVREAAGQLAAAVSQEASGDRPSAVAEASPATTSRRPIQAATVQERPVSASSSEAGPTAAAPRRPSKPSPLRTGTGRESRENSVPNTPNGEEPCLHFSTKKEDRLRKGRFKSAKFEVPRQYEAEELEEELGLVASDSFRRLLFAKDFKKHMEAADLLTAQIEPLAREVMSCMDLLLRWVVLRICEANTQCLLKVLDVTKALFALMLEQGYQLSEAEANTTLPCLVEKSGHNQDRIRQYHKELIRQAGGLVTTPRLLEHLLGGLGSKNTRTRVDCVELIGEVLAEEGLTPFAKLKQKPFAIIGQLVSERDKALRAAVLGAFEVLYAREGESAVWTLAGPLTDQQRSLIEERFRFAAKQAAKAASHRRLESNGNASDQSDVIPAHQPPRLGLDSIRTRSRPGNSSLDSVQSLGYPPSVLTATRSIEEAVAVPGGGRIQEPRTPQMRLPAAPPGGAIPTPAPRDSPLEEASPLPAALAAAEPLEDEELHDLFTAAVLKLADDDIEECVEALKSICYTLQMAAEGRTSPQFLDFLVKSTVEVIKGLTTKTDEIFDLVLEEAEASGQPADTRPCKYLVNGLLMAMEVPCVRSAVPKPVMADLIYVVLVKVLDDRSLPMLAHNPQIMRGLNVLMFKILNTCFGNTVFESLISLLLVSPADLQRRKLSPPEYERLVTKCIVKMTKNLPTRIQELNLNSLMLSIHEYFTTLGVDEIRRRGAADEKALRMVKTLVHELCKNAGEDIRSHMRGIPRDSDPIPIIHVYVDLHLETLQGAGILPPSAPNSARSDRTTADTLRESAHARGTSMQSLHSRSPSSQSGNLGFGAAPGTLTQRSSKEFKTQFALQPSAKEIVLPILQRIGVSGTSEQGLEELYFFMKEHPEVDTKPFIKRLSPEFHSFVERGLARLERRAGAAAGRLSTASSEASLDSSTNGPLQANGNSLNSEASLVSLGSRLRGLRLNSGESLQTEGSLPTMQDVAEMQERMRQLRRGAR